VEKLTDEIGAKRRPLSRSVGISLGGVGAGAVLRWGQGAQAPPVAAQTPQFPLMLFPDGLRAAVGWGPGPSRIFGLEPRLGRRFKSRD
jgi:hypothetical protein